MAPEFSRLPTERRNPRSRNLDRLSVRAIVALIAREDRRVPAAVAKVGAAIARAVDLVVARLRKGGRLIFIGAGTSGRLGVLEAAECPPTFGTPPERILGLMSGGPGAVFRSVEGAEDDPRGGAKALRRVSVGASDVVVGIAASGVTPFVRGALAEAKRRKAGRVFVTCNPSGVEADVVIAPRVGPEIVTGSTRLKAGTATKLVLNALTVASMTRLGKLYGNLMVDVDPRNEKLRARAVRIVREIAGVDDAEARRALESSGWKAKTAVVMLNRECDAAEAKRRLNEAGGFLRAVVDRR